MGFLKEWAVEVKFKRSGHYRQNTVIIGQKKLMHFLKKMLDKASKDLKQIQIFLEESLQDKERAIDTFLRLIAPRSPLFKFREGDNKDYLDKHG
jgi:hypothetical protein